MRRLTLFFSISICFFLLTSCSFIIKGVYGIKDPKPLPEKTILEAARSFAIPVEQCYELRKEYLTYLFSLDTAKHATAIHDHYQPLQALYYDSRGTLVSFHPNCYTGGFPNLKWNRAARFETFPPQSAAPIDTILPLATQLRFIAPLSSTSSAATAQYDVTVLIFWNKHMGRQSRRLVQTVQQNLQKVGNKKVKVLFVNNDNLLAL